MKCDYCMQDHNEQRWANGMCPTCGANRPHTQSTYYPGKDWLLNEGEAVRPHSPPTRHMYRIAETQENEIRQAERLFMSLHEYAQVYGTRIR
mgnify:CR=1 FL=1